MSNKKLGNDDVPVGRVVGKQVRFNSKVVVRLLPDEEAEAAEMARHSPWLAAPHHDEYWDGDAMTWRERELTAAELKELLFQVKVRRVLPTSIFNLFKKYRRRQSLVARLLEEEQLKRAQVDEEILPHNQRPAIEHSDSLPNALNGKKPTKQQAAQFDQYFMRLNRMDQPRRVATSLRAVVELNDTEDYRSPMHNRELSAEDAPRKRSGAVDHSADEEIMPFNVPRISVAEESVTGSEIGLSEDEDSEPSDLFPIATIDEGASLQHIAADDDTAKRFSARYSLPDSQGAPRPRKGSKKSKHSKSKGSSSSSSKASKATKSRREQRKKRSESEDVEHRQSDVQVIVSPSGLRASIAEVTKVNSYDADDSAERNGSTSPIEKLKPVPKTQKKKKGRKGSKSSSRSTGSSTISSENDPAPTEVEERINLVLSKLERLDGLSKSKVKRNARLREALSYYRNGSYSFSSLEQDLDAV